MKPMSRPRLIRWLRVAASMRRTLTVLTLGAFIVGTAFLFPGLDSDSANPQFYLNISAIFYSVAIVCAIVSCFDKGVKRE